MGDQARWPVALRFRPTRQELIFLLQLKVQGADIATMTDFVLEKNLYGKGMEPWKVFAGVDNSKWEFYDDAGKNDTKRVIYVITKLSKMSAKKTARTAGCGTWDAETPRKAFQDYQDNTTVGYWKLLKYVVDPGYESEGVDKGHWYMHEYSLSEHSLRETGVGSTDYVLCQIIRDDSKPCGVKSSNGKNVKVRGVGFGDHTGSSKVDEEPALLNNIQYGTSGTSMPPQRDNGITGPIISQEEFPGCYVENQCLAPSCVEGCFNQYYVGEQIKDNYYNDASTFEQNEMDWGVNLGAEIGVQQNNINTFSWDQSMLENQYYYNPPIDTAPVEEICGEDQQVSAWMCSGVQEIGSDNQEMMLGLPSVEDGGVIVIDEEENVQPVNNSGSVNSSAACARTVPTVENLTDAEQYISPEFLKLLEEDDPGLSPRFSETALAMAVDSWKSCLAGV